jgi:hypothetical protein
VADAANETRQHAYETARRNDYVLKLNTIISKLTKLKDLWGDTNYNKDNSNYYSLDFLLAALNKGNPYIEELIEGLTKDYKAIPWSPPPRPPPKKPPGYDDYDPSEDDPGYGLGGRRRIKMRTRRHRKNRGKKMRATRSKH